MANLTTISLYVHFIFMIWHANCNGKNHYETQQINDLIREVRWTKIERKKLEIKSFGHEVKFRLSLFLATTVIQIRPHALPFLYALWTILYLLALTTLNIQIKEQYVDF